MDKKDNSDCAFFAFRLLVIQTIIIQFKHFLES